MNSEGGIGSLLAYSVQSIKRRGSMTTPEGSIDRAENYDRSASRFGQAVLRPLRERWPSIDKSLWRWWYEVVSLRRGDRGPKLMNFGYAPLGEQEVSCVGDDEEYRRALYTATVGAVDLAGKDVLEAGCGRGGGALFVFENLGPRSLVGLDAAHLAVRGCNRRFRRPGLSFVAGDAEALPFPEHSFDAVLNVESSHHYPDTGRFLREVGRVLRPGGVLLFTDFRASHDAALAFSRGRSNYEDLDAFHRITSESGFVIREEEDITANVVRALDLATPSIRARANASAPPLLRQVALQFSGAKDSTIYRLFADRKLIYVRMVLEPET
jgi:ubiquinone/menaquinone biosynthesis C-methylase UbiE